ncbi:hypothetical protein [Pseudochrobactrum sp. MP213Fo]|uniref:hypothetical protein n=1 Tax=Pseudochrobactrum sp. MP213Fo TaxID=3022250 RepID=UPI003BA32F73
MSEESLFIDELNSLAGECWLQIAFKKYRLSREFFVGGNRLRIRRGMDAFNKPNKLGYFAAAPDFRTYVSVDWHHNYYRLNIAGYGEPPMFSGTRSRSVDLCGDSLDLDEYVEEVGILKEFIDTRYGVDIRGLRMISSYSADGGTSSFAAQVAGRTGLVVKGYEGAVTRAMKPSELASWARVVDEDTSFANISVASSMAGIRRYDRFNSSTRTWEPLNNSRKFGRGVRGALDDVVELDYFAAF